MTLQSDLTIDASKLEPEAMTESTRKLNASLMSMLDGAPRWWEVGPEKYRDMWVKGETAFPKRTVIESGEAFSVPSRETGREIPCRIMMPESSGQVKGVYMHIHGGGWVLQSEADQDPLLRRIANGSNVAVISLGYRLAPENPYPKGPEDCFDAGEWLVDNVHAKFGTELRFLGGESAGGHLAMLTALHLLGTRSNFQFSALVLNFGCYDMSFLPQARNFHRSPRLMLDLEIMEHFLEAFCPGMTPEERRKPSISPFFQDLSGLKLPPALFTCGTEDCMLDDSVMMAVRWQMTGTETILKFFAGSPHGFILFDPAKVDNARDVDKVIQQFLIEKLG